MIGVIAVALIAAMPDCTFDQSAMLALPSRTFDQVEHRGWRALADRGCDTAAADLIAKYRVAHGDDPLASTMRWHEGQLRANAGDYMAARPLFAASHNTRPPFNWFGWDDYVDATIAFIDRDRPALLAARARLAATPRPETHPWTDPDGSPIPSPTLAPGAAWPENIAVVDALIRCFDRDYRAAYTAVDCAKP